MTDALELSGRVPLLNPGQPNETIAASQSSFHRQLADWGFMAGEMPGIGQRVKELLSGFKDALKSTNPRMAEFTHDRLPQHGVGGNHGYFPFRSEVPRLSGGIPDPKEHIHVSGAMLDDSPAGAAEMLAGFPELERIARDVFGIAFAMAQSFSEVLRNAIAGQAPPLELSAKSTNLRVIHYRNDDGRTVLAHEHSGIQMLGVQLPPSDGGLEYVLNDGTWVEPQIANTDVVLCNVGRMLTFVSDGQLRPSTHRVHRNSSPGYERWSSVLFAYPEYDAMQWKMVNGKAERLDATWGDFIRNRFAAISAAPVGPIAPDESAD